MTFYEIDGGLAEAVERGSARLRMRLVCHCGGVEQEFAERDVLQADFFALREVSGGTSARGELVIDNTHGSYSAYGRQGAGAEIRVYYTIGEGLPLFHRWTLFVDGGGFRDVREGRRRYIRLVLRDRAHNLRESGKDWKEAAAFAYVSVCDKTKPETSLLHLIAKRAGLTAQDIDCCTIPLVLSFVRLTKNVWAELSALAAAFRCHLETATEKPLVFAHSPYQSEPLDTDGISYTFTGTDIFFLRVAARAGHYRNAVRLKVNMPVPLEKQCVWSYADAPVLYLSSLRPYYPFREFAPRDVEREGYQARYSVRDAGGSTRPVLYADMLDTKEEAEGRIEK